MLPSFSDFIPHALNWSESTPCRVCWLPIQTQLSSFFPILPSHLLLLLLLVVVVLLLSFERETKKKELPSISSLSNSQGWANPKTGREELNLDLPHGGQRTKYLSPRECIRRKLSLGMEPGLNHRNSIFTTAPNTCPCVYSSIPPKSKSLLFHM